MIRHLSAVAVASLVLSASFIADAAKKPVTCLAFTETTLPVDGTPTKVAICTDGKRPTVLTSYTITTIKDSDGKSVRAAIGYR